jgi:GntR family transcriptional regulator, transcriptional repressor for pyruvate dehydrogenase complex
MIQDKRLKRPERLADGIVSDVVQAVGEGRHAPGQKLPTESAMAVEYGVSRAVVREAIAELKADGMVSVRQGAGAYIADALGASSFKIASLMGLDEAKLRHLFELRLCVEGAAASLAATRRQAEDLVEIEACLKRMTSALGLGHDGSRDDGLFHEAVAKASRNPELARFVSFLGHAFNQIRKPSWTPQGRAVGLLKKQWKSILPSSRPLRQATVLLRVTPPKITTGIRKSAHLAARSDS